ncbi:TniQ family protein [Paraburkholderia sp. B3]|uniref:TniQ family protein n=1 Tax=Paraburkholderia sp. B3 TaxID=3134791 RepID=UPI00398263F8
MHAVTYHELLGYLGIPRRRDPDVQLPIDHLCRIGSNTRVAEKRLRSLGSVFKSVRDFPRVKTLLNFDIHGEPSYRVCALCLADDEVPYLRIQWRFKDWKYCPVHRNALMERCPECGVSIISTKVSLGHSPNGDLLDISHCYLCGHSRAHSGAACPCATIDDRELAVQNFLVSAVLHGHFFIEGFAKRFDLDFLLWLRGNYQWDGPRVAPTNSATADARAI